jgi:hypothetical protein
LITLVVGIFASVFVFKRDPDDGKNEAAQKSTLKPGFEPEAVAFGLVSAPAEPALSRWARATAAIKGLGGRLTGK